MDERKKRLWYVDCICVVRCRGGCPLKWSLKRIDRTSSYKTHRTSRGAPHELPQQMTTAFTISCRRCKTLAESPHHLPLVRVHAMGRPLIVQLVSICRGIASQLATAC